MNVVEKVLLIQLLNHLMRRRLENILIVFMRMYLLIHLLYVELILIFKTLKMDYLIK